jgi:rod shape-determining protein MreD
MSRLVPSRLTVVQAVLLVVAALLGAAIVPRFAPIEPDLVLPVVVAGGLRGGRSTGILLGLAAGWLIDVIPPGTGTFGLTALTYATAGLLAGTLHRSLRHSAVLPAVAVLGAALVVWGVRLLADLLAARPLDLSAATFSVLATTLLGALLAPALVHHQQRLIDRGRA